uniref:LIM zinc-binding domain-containing protein n=1 Tax=Panagrolaimus superbus TaxID=310955 RepID=A0A914YKR4_9BILA
MGPPTGNGVGSGNNNNFNQNNSNQSSSTSHHQKKYASTFGGGGGGSDDRRNCALCNSSLGEEAVVAMNRLWHPDHFLCNGCKKPIRQTFQVSSFF